MSLYSIYFSPTGGTKKVMTELTNAWNSSLPKVTLVEVDLSDAERSASALSHIHPGKKDICLIGIPSFGGRVPAVALKRLSPLKADGAPAILVAAYGNRAYDDTLLELQEAAKRCGLCVSAAIAAVTEHSVMRQYGTGRPDAQDRAELRQFALQIKKNMESGTPTQDLSLPGSHPFKKYNGLPLSPKAGKACTNCGACAAACPVGAIPALHPELTDKNLCISCMRCIRICPANARALNKVLLLAAGRAMKKACSGHKKNEIYPSVKGF